MKNIIVLLIISLFVVTSCSKEYDDKSVTYQITGLEKDFRVSFIDEEGATITEYINPLNADDVWKYSFTGTQGDIVYLFSEFKDIDLDPTKFKFRILIDGKVYKDAYNYDKNIGDTLFRVRRSGTIPF